MNKIWMIIKREYISRVKTKAFILTTLLAPLGIVLLMSFQFIVLLFSGEDTKLLVKDDSGYFNIPNITGSLITKLQDEKQLSSTIYFKPTDGDFQELIKTFSKDGYDGVLYIPKFEITENKSLRFELHSKNYIGINKVNLLRDKLKEVVRTTRIKEAGLPDELMASLNKINIEITETTEAILKSGDDADKLNGRSNVAYGVGFAMGFLMYLVIIIYGTSVMKGISEEKNNRIVEVILSSVKPFQLMIGKIIGIGIVGLTQFIIWGILSAITYFVFFLVVGNFVDLSAFQSGMPNQANVEDQMLQVNSVITALKDFPMTWMLLFFLFYFLGGYLLYASLFAAVGALVGEESDSQAMVFPVTLPIIISFFCLFALFENPSGSVAVWASILPFSSPINMPARLAFGFDQVPLWQLLLSMISLVLGFIFTTWVAAKIYRVGILIYGKKITFKEVGKWLFYPN